MNRPELDAPALVELGLEPGEAWQMEAEWRALDPDLAPEQVWMHATRAWLRPDQPMDVHRLLRDTLFEGWPLVPAWFPEDTSGTNVAALMRHTGLADVPALHAWSVSQPEAFWTWTLERLGIDFQTPPTRICDADDGPENARWLPGARFDLVARCLRGPEHRVALVLGDEDGGRSTVTLGELRRRVGRVAHGLARLGLEPGEPVALAMPMHADAVALFLGAMAAGHPVVGIAESLAPDEIAVRLEIGGARWVFTQESVLRRGVRLPLAERVRQAGAAHRVVVGGGVGDDLAWDDFLDADDTLPDAVRSPDDTLALLFSSGTTAAPKAIPWDHTTALKAAMDAHLHHDVHPGDVLCWPTSMGWMMGPWLIFAALLNDAAIVCFDGAPATAAFCRFVADAKVTLLGCVPSLVAAWRAGDACEGVDWSAIRAFSSTGECSRPDDMLWLMARAGYRPVIEYCGGTEIGGGYVTGTDVQPSVPGAFSTPAFGSDFEIHDDGELFLVPPALGLSRRLHGADHHAVYHDGVPAGVGGRVLRRHGDRMERLPGGYLRALGRADDAMNLGGIKVGAVEIEAAVATVPGVRDAAAVAVAPPDGGPARLVVFVVADAPVDAAAAQAAIRTRLSPLYRLHALVPVDSLPRTASNKLLRRELRARAEATL